MTQLKSYVQASIPEPYTIFGVRLRPYCLGHYFLMERFGVSFVDETENRESSILDLLLGIAICARTYQEFLDFINDEEEFNSWFSEWGKQVKKQLKGIEPIEVIAKFKLFQDYMRDGVIVPKYFTEEGDIEDASGAHWTQSILLVLTSELGYSHTEALNLPLSKALFDYFKYAETNGSVSLMKDDELELVEGLQNAEA